MDDARDADSLVRALQSWGLHHDSSERTRPASSAAPAASSRSGNVAKRTTSTRDEQEQEQENDDDERDDVVVAGAQAQQQQQQQGADNGALPEPDSFARNNVNDSDEDQGRRRLSGAQKKQAAKEARLASASKVNKNLLRSSTFVVTTSSSSIDNDDDDDDGREEKEKEQRHELTSWKMADYAYKREPCPFPTRARGLFTAPCHSGSGTQASSSKEPKGKQKQQQQEQQEEQAHDSYRIVVRGYDKFFNVGEVSWTKWDELPKRTKAPYELTHKSNGCIILIAALTPRDLLVTSKHSLGAVVGGGGGDGESPGPSHSQMGERWLERTLNAAKRTKRQLARELWLNNLTAVAELCDDSFEEHVLPYGPEQTGLHLHGLNRNTARFNTLPSADVQRFASEWGFIPTPFTTFDSVDSLRAYCDTVSKQGGIKRDNDDGDGPIEPVEGFVVRALKTDALNDGDYFFWKVKFDEPYLMYREWREITRKIIKLWEADARREASAVRPRTQDLLSPDPSSRFEARKLKNPLSRLYALWVERAYRLDPPAFDDWKQGRGIVATRERFLAWADSSPEALELKRRFNADLPTTDTASDTRPFEKTLVAPVAIPGLGKTFVGLALARVFGWPHVQSDDITFKKSGPHFVKAVSDSFEKSDVVIADKNNHTKQLRSSLVQLRARSNARIRRVAVVWDLSSLPRDQLHALCASRVVSRGDRHQSLRAGEEHESIIWMFMGQLEDFDPSIDPDRAFDNVIQVNVAWDKREMVTHVATELAQILGVPVPTQAQLDEAIATAEAYRPSVRKDMGPAPAAVAKKAMAPRYYGVALDGELEGATVPFKLEDWLDGVFGERRPSLYETLKSEGRVEQHPHVTVVHEKETAPAAEKKDGATKKQQQAQALAELDDASKQELEAKRALWADCAQLVTAAGGAIASADSSNAVRVTLGPRIACTDKVISVEVSALSFVHADQVTDDDEGQSASKRRAVLEDEASGRRAHHVTVGTAGEGVRPVEGKLLMERVREGTNTQDVTIVEVSPVTVLGTLRGLK